MKHYPAETEQELMKLGFTWTLVGLVFLALLLTVTSDAQQSGAPIIQNSGQASQPVAGSNGPGRVGSDMPPATQPAANPTPPAPEPSTKASPAAASTSIDDNPYDPLLEPPPLPKGKTTLIGGIATSVDHVRNRLTVQPFGKGTKLKVFVDERSHIYRNGTETTILGVHKGDRVYVDTMLSADNRIFARNVRVLTDTGVAEVRGQVIGTNPERGTISVRDQLSAKPVTFSISGATKYSSTKGSASSGDVQTGSLIDVQFAPRRDQAVAKDIVILAKPGDNYIFSGVVSSIDMRTSSFFVDNKSDDQSYEVHFTRSAVSDPEGLKVGAEVTARTVFDGKQYTANNVRVEKPDQNEPGQQSEVQ
jgi:uncharacterized protein DUF5666